MNHYEMLCIVSTRLAEGNPAAAQELIAGEIAKASGQIQSLQVMGRKRLAYPIARQQEGLYLLVYFSQPPASAPVLRANLRMNEFVLRILILKRDASDPIPPDPASAVPAEPAAPASPAPAPAPAGA